MPEIGHTEHIRRLIQHTFSQFGTPSDASPDETILVREGHYCGHRFQCEGLRAVWFVEEDQIKFYGEDGTILKVVSPSQASSCDRTRAA